MRKIISLLVFLIAASTLFGQSLPDITVKFNLIKVNCQYGRINIIQAPLGKIYLLNDKNKRAFPLGNVEIGKNLEQRSSIEIEHSAINADFSLGIATKLKGKILEDEFKSYISNDFFIELKNYTITNYASSIRFPITAFITKEIQREQGSGRHFVVVTSVTNAQECIISNNKKIGIENNLDIIKYGNITVKVGYNANSEFTRLSNKQVPVFFKYVEVNLEKEEDNYYLRFNPDSNIEIFDYKIYEAIE